MDQLGSPMTTHALAEKMRAWFAEEVERKKGLLRKNLPSGRLTSETGPIPELSAQLLTETTPSVTEPSGVRIRGTDTPDLAGDVSTTPSGAWDPRGADYGTSRPARGGAQFAVQDLHGETSVDARASELFGDATDPSGPPSKKGRLLLLIGLALLAVVMLVVVVLFVVPGLLVDSGGSEGPGAGSLMTDTSTVPMTGEVPTRPPPMTPTPTGGAQPAGLASAPEAATDGGASAVEPQPAQEPETVEISLEINADRPAVTIDGEPQSDPNLLTLPRADEPLSLRIAAPGYQATSITITPDRDQTRRVSLRRRRARDVTPTRPTKRGRQPVDLLPSPYGN
jgi:hypothetical protein